VLFQYVNCAMLLRNARMSPNDTECARRFAPAVAVIPIRPASRSGQHHDPTRAGSESSMVSMAGKTPTAPDPAPVADALPTMARAGVEGGGISQVTHSSSSSGKGAYWVGSCGSAMACASC